ncbi:MAG: hypothetical protein ABTS22_11420 [Accumulibacter sp.]|uniref:hypothetical protein n=1 Tax=Accumulibacter sp. TaxID=2053492 RepID=UPI0033152A93
MSGETYAGTSGSGARAGIWSAIVLLDGADVSARVVGDIRIDAEEDSARIAELTLRPTGGTTFAIADWVGKSLTIDIADVSSGSATDVQRLFTGIVDTPTLNLDLRTIAIRATDNLQNLVEAMDAAAIDAEIPDGYHSPVIFDPAARGWSRAQDRLSTVPQSLDLTPAGVMRVTDWAPAVSPAMSFTAAHLLDGSLAVSLSSRHSLVNRVDVDFGYRFPRVKAEGWPLSYSYVDETNIDTFVDGSNQFLTRAAVEDAIEAAGGTVESITYTALPSTTIGSWVPGPQDYLLCMGFDAVVSFDYAQMIEEQHSITVSAPNSIAAVGTLSDRMSGALEGQYPPIPTAEAAMLLYRNAISGIPPQDTATPSSGYTTAANVTLTADTDRAAANAAMETLIAAAKVRIWASHRRNTVSARVALNPGIDLDKTIDLADTGLHARGKCSRLSHVLSPDTGEATTEFSVAICSVAGTGVSHAETPTTAPTGSSPASTTLTGSATADYNYGPSEDKILTVTFPGVEAVERNKANIAISSSYSAPLTEDIFTITL